MKTYKYDICAFMKNGSSFWRHDVSFQSLDELRIECDTIFNKSNSVRCVKAYYSGRPHRRATVVFGSDR